MAWTWVKRAFRLDRDMGRFLIGAVVLVALWNIAVLALESQAVNPTEWVASERSMLAFLFRNVFRAAVSAIFGVLLLLNYLRFDRNILYGRLDWKNETVTGVRWAVGVICCLVAYYFLSADVNLFAGQTYALDRIVLVILACLVFVNPAFVPMFVLYGFSFNLQYSIPLGYSDLHHLNLLFEFLTLFSLYVGIKTVAAQRVSFMHVLLLTGARLASGYVYSAFGKLLFIDGPFFAWVAQNRVSHFVAGAYISNSWLGFLAETQFLQLLSFLGRIEVLLAIYTILAELAIVLVFFRNRKVSVVLLGMIIALHLGIFTLTGVLFRAWLILVVACLVILMLQDTTSTELQTLYRLPVTVFTILFVLCAPWILSNMRMFAWWDTNVYPVFDYEIVTTDGDTYPLERDFLRQIEDLHRGRYWTLIDETTPGSNSWGGLIGWKFEYPAYPFFAAASAAEGVEEIPSVIETYGSNRFEADALEQFEHLIEQAFTHYNERQLNKRFLAFLPQPPLNFNVGRDSRTEYYSGQAPVESVHVIYKVRYYNPNENAFYTIEDRVIYQIDIEE